MTLFAGVVVGLIIAGLSEECWSASGLGDVLQNMLVLLAFVVGFLFFMAEAL